MNTIPFLLLAGLGWGGLAYVLNRDAQTIQPTSNCADVEFERDSLKIKNNQWIAIMDSIN